MEVSEKQDLVTRVRETREAADAALVTLSDLNFQYAAGFVKEARHMALVAAKAAAAINKIVAALSTIERDIAELEVADGDD